MFMHFRKNNYYCNVYLQPTLFGTDSLVCSWGNMFTNGGGYKTIFCTSDNEVKSKLHEIKKRRKYRGYVLVDCDE